MNTNNKKIALFMMPLLTEGGGTEKYFINLARNLNAFGIKTDVITMDESFFKLFAICSKIVKRELFQKITTKGKEKESLIKYNLGEAKWIKSSFNNLKKILNKYDVIYTKNEVLDLLLLKFTGFKKIPPIIIGVHTPIYWPFSKSFYSKFHNIMYLSPFYKWLLNNARYIHVSNEFSYKLIENKFHLKTNLIYYPFSRDEIIAASKKHISNFVFNSRKINIIYTGRFSEQKGSDIFIRIINIIKKDKNIINRISINILGSGDSDKESVFKKYALEYPWLKYFGYLENKYIPNVLSKQNLFITTSRWETLPYNVLEAQAMGLPIIAFDIPGINDIVQNKVTGILVQNENEFIEKLQNYINGKYCFNKKIIIENIQKKFNPVVIYDKLFTMFKELLKYND